LISIEPTSATWRAIESQLKKHHAELVGNRLLAVESFGAVVQMVKAGFGDGLVPLGLVREARLPRRSHRVLPLVARDVVLLTRKTIDQSEGYRALRDRLSRLAPLVTARSS
jgi:DNA-binding transcriptional LysR family regulator